MYLYNYFIKKSDIKMKFKHRYRPKMVSEERIEDSITEEMDKTSKQKPNVKNQYLTVLVGKYMMLVHYHDH